MKYVLAFLIAALPVIVLAQSNYYPGYVIKNNGDTIKGYINYHEWTQSPMSIDFKVSKSDGTAQQFNPQVIKGFTINSMETYVSYAGFISTGTTDFSILRQGLDTGKRADAVFLKQMVTGRFLTLFYQSDNTKSRYFIAETNQTPVELNYYAYIDTDRRVANSSVYKGQLILYINKFRSGNDKLMVKVEQTKYTQTDLQNIVNEINDSKTVGRKSAFTRFYAGISINNTTTEVDNPNGLNGIQTASSVSPKINAGVDIFGNPNIQQFILRVELSYSYINPKVKFGGVSGYAADDVFTFNQYTTSVTPQLLFNVYNKDKLKVYIDAGVAFNISSYSNNKFSSHGITYENMYRLEGFWSNFPVQAGVVLNKKLEFCFTYTGYAAYTKSTVFSAANKIASVGVKYLFSK